jgi:hypothetical protein
LAYQGGLFYLTRFYQNKLFKIKQSSFHRKTKDFICNKVWELGMLVQGHTGDIDVKLFLIVITKSDCNDLWFCCFFKEAEIYFYPLK